MSYIAKILALTVVAASTPVIANQNTEVTSFNTAKKLLMKNVYDSNTRSTVYCNASFTQSLEIIAPAGFESTKYLKRQKKVEFEHIVPAENFGRAIAPEAWNFGDAACTTKSGKSYKGRRCATKVSDVYKRAQADMHNLYAAIGAVNALRSNHNFVMQPEVPSSFGSCDMRIKGNKAQPPEPSRGIIARSYMYMEETYPMYSMSKSQRQLMNAWDKMHPATIQECSRYKVIDKLQGSFNKVLASRC